MHCELVLGASRILSVGAGAADCTAVCALARQVWVRQGACVCVCVCVRACASLISFCLTVLVLFLAECCEADFLAACLSACPSCVY